MSSDHWVRDCYFSLVLAWLLQFLVILVHEWAHWACARWLGFPAPRVVIGLGQAFLRMRWRETSWHFQLLPVMGYVLYAGGNQPRPGRRVLVSLAGPAANLVLAAALFLALPKWQPVVADWTGPLAIVGLAAGAYREGPIAILHLFAAFNLGVGLFNLLPLPPLDGSVLLREPAMALHRASPGSFSGEWWSRAWTYLSAAVLLAVGLFTLLGDSLV